MACSLAKYRTKRLYGSRIGKKIIQAQDGIASEMRKMPNREANVPGHEPRRKLQQQTVEMIAAKRAASQVLKSRVYWQCCHRVRTNSGCAEFLVRGGQFRSTEGIKIQVHHDDHR
jgi:phage baseplate assembly protein W